MELLSLSIDGKTVICPAGTSILRAAEMHGIKIPTLCDHPDLKPFGACRICLVEDEVSGRLMASCVTPSAQDMIVHTNSDRIKKHRRNIVRLMMAEHPESCVVCSKGNRCRLRQVAAQLGVGETNLYHMPNHKPFEEANPFIIRDLSKCILCGKCIRADHELVVVGAIDYNLRGFESRPATVHELSLEQSSCTFCGTCVSMCPTGALFTRNFGHVGSPERESLSICGFCSVGCTLLMGVTGKRIVDVNPAQLAESVNGATLCVRGHFAHDFLNSPQRIISPMCRKNDNRKGAERIPMDWDEVLDLIAERLIRIRKENGPESIAFFGSSKCSNEENYLFQKIARALIGTNNIDNGGYLFGRSLMKVFDEIIDGVPRNNRLADLDEAEAVLVIGADPSHSVPVVGYCIKRAAQRGIPLIVADPRQTELVNFASKWLRIRPQTDLELVNGLSALLYEKKAYDRAFIDQYTEGFSLITDGLGSLDLDRVCRVTELEMDALDETVELVSGKKIAIVIGNGIMQQRYGSETIKAIINLSLMTGSLGFAGSGLYVLAKENNQIGALDMGGAPDLLPGRQSLGNEAARRKWEENWKAGIPPEPGLNMMGIIEAAEKGNLKALYIMGENPLRAFPETNRVKRALQKIEFVVVQDILDGETAEIADVVLPGASLCEKEGSVTNMEGRIQSFKPVVPAPEKARPDWEILDLLAAKLGRCDSYGSLEKIREEIRRFVPMYASLDGHDPGWVKTLSGKTLFGTGGLDGLIPFSPVVSVEDDPADTDHPLTAIVGSMRYHLGSGTRTQASGRIQELGLGGELEISPEDGEKFDVKNNDTVIVRSKFGDVARKVRLNMDLRSGYIFVPAGFNDNDAMNLFGLFDMTKPDFPGWKTCCVKLEKR